MATRHSGNRCLPDHNAQALPEGAIVSARCWVAVMIRWITVVAFELAALTLQLYRVVAGSPDPVNDLTRAITASFSKPMAENKNPRITALLNINATQLS
eukprot:5053926-Amphidinium_carterae.1